MFGSYSLRNFPLYLNDMTERLDMDVVAYAVSMARCLATMHWELECDASDIEFVLGSVPLEEEDVPDLSVAELDQHARPTTTRPAYLEAATAKPFINFKKRAVHLWVLDFNLVKRITMDEEGVEAAAYAIGENDAYYPKPLDDSTEGTLVWSAFEDAYIQASDRICKIQEIEGKVVTWRGLPEKVIEAVVAKEAERLKKKAEAEARIANYR